MQQRYLPLTATVISTKRLQAYIVNAKSTVLFAEGIELCQVDAQHPLTAEALSVADEARFMRLVYQRQRDTEYWLRIQ